MLIESNHAQRPLEMNETNPPEIIPDSRSGPGETPFQLFYLEDMKEDCLPQPRDAAQEPDLDLSK